MILTEREDHGRTPGASRRFGAVLLLHRVKMIIAPATENQAPSAAHQGVTRGFSRLANLVEAIELRLLRGGIMIHTRVLSARGVECNKDKYFT